MSSLSWGLRNGRCCPDSHGSLALAPMLLPGRWHLFCYLCETENPDFPLFFLHLLFESELWSTFFTAFTLVFWTFLHVLMKSDVTHQQFCLLFGKTILQCQLSPTLRHSSSLESFSMAFPLQIQISTHGWKLLTYSANLRALSKVLTLTYLVKCSKIKQINK
jgi:hypothetical protein